MHTVAELWQMLWDAQSHIDLQHKELDWIHDLFSPDQNRAYKVRNQGPRLGYQDQECLN